MNRTDMPDSLAHTHGDENGIDIEPYMERALEDVIETILTCGEYQQQRAHIHGMIYRRFRPRLFDLHEWLAEHVNEDEMRDLYISMLTDFSVDHDSLRQREVSRIEAMLREELLDSPIVADRALQLAEEAREDAR